MRIATSLCEQAEFAAIRLPLGDIRYMMSALAALKHHAKGPGLSPESYGEEIQICNAAVISDKNATSCVASREAARFSRCQISQCVLGLTVGADIAAPRTA